MEENHKSGEEDGMDNVVSDSRYRPLTPLGIVTDLVVAIKGEEEPPTLRESTISGIALIIIFITGVIMLRALELLMEGLLQ